MTTLRYHERTPNAALRPYFECLWMASDSRRRAGRAPERIIPDGCPELIVHLGDRFRRRVGTRWVQQPVAFLAGTLSGVWTLRGGARLRTLGLRFRPGALTALFPFDMKRAVDREVRLEALVGEREARDFLRRLRRAGTRERCFDVAERWLLDRLAGTPKPRPGLARPAVELILRSRGQHRIDAIAEKLGVTRRRLERAFGRDLGIRPKLFARIVRLQAVLSRLDQPDRIRAVDLALEAGYFDQAHLARDFRAVAGRRLGEGAGHQGEMARHFVKPSRLLAYLAGE